VNPCTAVSELVAAVESNRIPALTALTLADFLVDGMPTGDYLRAVLSNDLMGAFNRADDENTAALPEVVKWCRWHLPSGAWGSGAKVDAWESAAGYRGTVGLSDAQSGILVDLLEILARLSE
jgi:hypothetical protein